MAQTTDPLVHKSILLHKSQWPWTWIEIWIICALKGTSYNKLFLGKFQLAVWHAKNIFRSYEVITNRNFRFNCIIKSKSKMLVLVFSIDFFNDLQTTLYVNKLTFFNRCEVNGCEHFTDTSWQSYAIPMNEKLDKLESCKIYRPLNGSDFQCLRENFLNETILCDSYIYENNNSLVKEVS